MYDYTQRYFIYFLSILAGLACVFAFNSCNYYWILFVVNAFLFFFIRKADFLFTIFFSLLFGFSFYVVNICWIYITIYYYGNTHVVLAFLLTVLFCLFIASIFIVPPFVIYQYIRKFYRVDSVIQQAFLFSSLWVLFEWIRCWLLGGFPWLLQGYALIDTPLKTYAPIFGVLGLSFLLVLSSSLIVVSVISNRSYILFPFSILLLVFIIYLGSLCKEYQWTNSRGELSFASIQGNIDQTLKWKSDFIPEIMKLYLGYTRDNWGSDLIIWPENALPLFYNEAIGLLEQLDREAKFHNSVLLIGMLYGNNKQYYNSLVALGLSSSVYKKKKLVPFGEYIPFSSFLRGLINFFDIPMSNFTAGEVKQSFIKTPKANIATFICYESAYPNDFASHADGSDLIVIVSDNSWFGISSGQYQHMQLARMRALETGRYIIHSTNNGETVLINNYGEIEKKIAPYQALVLNGTALTFFGKTPFMIWKSYPILILCTLIIIFIFFNAKNNKRKYFIND